MTAVSPPLRAAPARRRWPWLVAGALLLAGVGGGVYVARSRAAQAGTAAAVPTTATVQAGVLRVSVSGPGTLEAAATRTVGADLTATVGALPAVGERVTRGELLTRLTSDTVDDNVQTAQLNLQKAQAALDATRASQAGGAASRAGSVTGAQGTLGTAQQTLADASRALGAQEALYAVGAASAQALADARAAVTRAQLGVDSARASLATAQAAQGTGSASDAENLRSQQVAVQQARSALDTALKARAELKVYAPMGGVVSTLSATEGTVVTSGASILTLIDDTTLNLPVQVDETEIAGVRAGQTAEVTLDAYPDQTFSGKVVRVSPGAAQSNGISVFTATVQLANTAGQLRPGMTAEAEIIQKESRGLLVPSKAIQTVRTRAYVQLPGAAGADPERVRVETGDTDGTNTVVTSGLSAGQEVVVPGAARSTSGTSPSTRQSQGGASFGPPPGGLP